MVRERDVCWEYCEKLEGNKVRCNFCEKVLNGGISRLKHHLSRLPSKGVHPCAKVGNEITERVKDILATKEEGKENGSAKKQCLVESSKSSLTVVPSSKLLMSPPPQLPKLFPSCNMLKLPLQPTLDADRCIAEFFFENKLDFSVARSSSYQLMLEAIGGPGFRGPSCEDLRTTWLQTLKSEVNLRIKDVEREWISTGCTVIADTWTCNKSRVFINFFVSSPSGIFFHKTVDASPFSKNTLPLFDLFNSVIQDLGPDNVVQVIADNGLNYDTVGNQIMNKYSTIFWSPCASHCVNQMLEDISEIDWVARCIFQAQSVTKFVYNNTWLLDLMRRFTNGQDIVRASTSKSTSSFLTLQAILKHKSRLKHMFNSPEYSSSSYANRPHSTCVEILDDNEFWRAVEEVAAVCEPLLKVLRDVSGGKPAVGSIYESMTRAKESIRTYYIMDEGKCKAFLDIVDRRWQTQLHSSLHAAGAFLNPSIQYNPEVKFLSMVKEEFFSVLEKLLPTTDLRHNITEQIGIFRKSQGMFGSNLAREARHTAAPGIWWEQYGDSAPGLQRVAVRILNQVCSTSIFEKNSSSYQQIHSSERHNKLDKETLDDLLYVHYNLKLQAKGKPLDIDPILIEEIDMASDWVEDPDTSVTTTPWLDRFSSTLDGGDLNTRQFSSSIFSTNDHLFNL